MPKMTRWLGPTTTQRFKTPSGPLSECMGGYADDYSRQMNIMPHQIGRRQHTQRTMNSGGGAAGKHLTSLDSASAPIKNVER